MDDRPVSFPEHALLILEERLKEQEAEGIRLPMHRTELAVLILMAAEAAERGWLKGHPA